MQASVRPVTVLLIDDQEMAAELIHQKLDGQAIGFHYEPDGAQAVTRCRELQPSVVLVDLRMPAVDGLQVLQALRMTTDTARLPVVLLSSEDAPEIKAEAFARGANDYLVKWPDRQELVARLRYHSAAWWALKERDEAFASLRKSQEALLKRTQELAQSQAALHHAKKMEAIGQLTGGVAHDFNNVLQVISGNLEMLRLLTAGNEAAQKRIAAAVEGVARGARLSGHLLAFARRQPLQTVVLDVTELLDGMDELLRRTLGNGIDVRTEARPGLWHISADPVQLENVILNLAFNARDAMSGDGVLTLKAFNASPGAVSTDPSGDYVQIEVVDNGHGMSQEVLDRVFEPFFTTKPLGHGTGLGLSMAYGYVKQSGGQIRLESTPGEGTVVRLLLPRAQGAASLVQAPRDTAPTAAATGGRILVVEDEREVRETAVAYLETLGYTVWQAADGASALALIEDGAEIDLLFTDVIMPGALRGRELAERAREHLPGLQVLYTSGYPEGELGPDGRLDPAIRLLRKPYDGENLAREVAQMLTQPAHPALCEAEAVADQERGT